MCMNLRNYSWFLAEKIKLVTAVLQFFIENKLSKKTKNTSLLKQSIRCKLNTIYVLKIARH